MRDDFTAGTKELLAKRVGFSCSNPECRQVTSGPQSDPAGVVNIGVAAHISAASNGGPRFDADLSPEQRADSSNGIWLCQTCAKLVDNDATRFNRAVLEAWKRAAERAAGAALASGGRETGPHLSQQGFAKAERLMPALLAEMREDLCNHPTTREFVVLKRGWVYNSEGFYLAYYLDEHEDLGASFKCWQTLDSCGRLPTTTCDALFLLKSLSIT